MQKIDVHIHAAPETIYKGEKIYVSDADSMVAHMDELGIETAVLMSVGESPATLGYNEGNRMICSKYPHRFRWMCNTDLSAPEDVYDKLKRCKEQGAVGIGELTHNLPIDHPFIEAIFSAAHKLSLPVTFHMSPSIGYNYGIVDAPGLPGLERALQKFPRVKFLGHSQVFWIEISADAPTDDKGRNSWGKGPVLPGGRVVELFEKYPNLYGDLSANSAGRAIMRDETFGLWFLHKFADRLFFATDMLNTSMVMPLGGWLEEKLQEGKLSATDYEKIIRGNACSCFLR